MNRVDGGSIRTIKERCRVCYTCVRECPAKAIRINDGQAEVLAVRCIGCGNCVRVCSQKAKQVVSTIDSVKAFFNDASHPVLALVAPSFPAEFTGMDERTFVGMVRALGFAGVHEVSFGADLVARRYRELTNADGARPSIATTCPAVVLYVEKYCPSLVGSLAPVVSPMVAMARVVRRIRGGKRCRVVFLGPCIAKKVECVDGNIRGDVDAVLTFAEVRQMFEDAGLKTDAGAKAEPSDFDPPRAGTGALFPLSRGLLQAAKIPEDLLDKRIIATDGCADFVDAVKAFEAGAIDTRLLELLACEGCIMGAGMTSPQSLFRRRASVSEYVRRKLREFDPVAWQRDMDRFADIDLSRRFTANDQRTPMPTEADLRAILTRMGKQKPEDELNCGACGYATCREHAVAIHTGLAESEMCLPYTIDRLNKTVEELAYSNNDLANTQEALMQSERLASMGQLAAGIAHEVNNPLGVVLMYAHLLLEQLDEKSKLRGDAMMIAEQADRCRRIVSGLLHFARQNKVLRDAVDVRTVVERSCKLVVKPANVTLEIEHMIGNNVAEIDADQVLQVFVNLINNAYAAMPSGGRLKISTGGNDTTITITFEDTGMGIPPENKSRIFEPFFTTKQPGSGSGLGLSISYGIIKMHRGSIRVESNHAPEAGPTGTRFVVELPRKDLE
ncbi:MAG: [Fe-Fe] hydrogenase large subunit C-terminal domain-containing protein [bacterium]